MLGAIAVDGLAPLYYSDATCEHYLFIPQNVFVLGAMAVDGLAPLYYSDVTWEPYLFIPQNAEVSLSLY